MTQDEIIEMTRQADIRDSLEYDHMECNIESLEAFAKLVAEHEREACAKVCEASPEPDGLDLADRIRARGDNHD